jgi:hypothetical protein
VQILKQIAERRVSQMRAEAELARAGCARELEEGRPDPAGMARFARLAAEAEAYERAAREIIETLEVALNSMP